MDIKGLVNFFKPDKYTAITFIALILIMIGGNTQSYAFVKDSGTPMSPFYKELEPFPIWPLWMFLIVPLVIGAMIVSVTLTLILGNDLTQTIMSFITTGPIAWAAVLIYFYVIASIVSFIVKKILK